MRLRFIILALLLPAISILAAPLRVTVLDLEPRLAVGMNGWSNEFQQRLVQEAAESLKKLHPEIILVQHAADWGTCRQLAQALAPDNFQVATCSSFRNPHAKLLNGQVAILTKPKAYISWSEPWISNGVPSAPTGGFAFAAVRWNDKNIGLFSVQLSALSQQDRAESSRQLHRQITSLQDWKDNRLEAFVVAADGETNPEDLRLDLKQMGFENAAVSLFAGNVRQPAVMLRHASLLSPPQITRMAFAEHAAATCEISLSAPPAQTNRLSAPTALANAAAPASPYKNLFWLTSFLTGCLGIFLIARKLAGRPVSTTPVGPLAVLPPVQSSPYVQIVTDQSPQTQSQIWPSPPDAKRIPARVPEAVRAGVIANLTQWFKEKVVQRLLSDRTQLLATQEAAARKMMAVDERLSKIEIQIKQRNQEYERRIDELLKALLTAKEENRELIRAKIALLKTEMEKARRQAAQAAAERQQN